MPVSGHGLAARVGTAKGIRDKPIAPGSPWQSGFAPAIADPFAPEDIILQVDCQFDPAIS
jgi:hypothetical protein